MTFKENIRIEVIRGEIAKLELRSGDSLLFKTKLILTTDQVNHLKKYLEPLAPPGVKFLVVDGQFDLQVVRAA